MMFLRLLLMIGTVTAAGFAVRGLARLANKKYWHQPIIDRTARLLPYFLLMFSIIWGVGSFTGINSLRALGSSFSALILLVILALIISLPPALLLGWLAGRLANRPPMSPKADPVRRRIIGGTVAILPFTATSAMGMGFGASFSRTRVPEIEIDIPNLPRALDGFRILHLSDLHLGYYFGLDHVEQTLLDAEKHQPHMVVVTGDIADDLSLMTDTMKLIGQLKTPYPPYASVGNHEYFRGIRESIRRIEAGPIPLLLDKHDVFEVNGTPVVIGGANDPVHLGGDISGFLDDSLKRAFHNAPEGPFRLLMSHRPRALDVAEKNGVGLVLSGHTHAGQVGVGGRSFWELFNENGYLWGRYKKGNARLYTSAGMGHWFPFRLGVPLEAPLIILRRVENAG